MRTTVTLLFRTALATTLCICTASLAGAVGLTQVLSVYVDKEGAALKSPRSVACNDSTLIVADTGNRRLLKYAVDERNLQGGAEIKIRQLSNPLRIKVDSSNNIVVLDGKTSKIVRLDADGAFLGFVEPSALPKARGWRPASFDLGTDDSLWILDTVGERVVVLEEDGTFRRQLRLPAGSGVFADVAVDTKNTLFLLDTVDARVFKAAPEDEEFSFFADLREEAFFPTSIATDSRGLVFVVDQNGGSILFLAQQDGSFQGRGLGYGWHEARLRYPGDFCVNSRGQGFVADRANDRIQVVTIVR